MSAQPEPVARETRLVDPRALVTRANVRAVAEPDPELVESIRANGIIQPPVVYADDWSSMAPVLFGSSVS